MTAFSLYDASNVAKACHYGYVIMGVIASRITSLTIVYSTVYSDADQRKHQSSASLAFVRGIHRGPLNSPHKWPVTRKMFPFDDVIMWNFKASTGENAGETRRNKTICIMERLIQESIFFSAIAFILDSKRNRFCNISEMMHLRGKWRKK